MSELENFLKKAIEIISSDQQESYKNASNKLLKDNVNVSDFVVNLID